MKKILIKGGTIVGPQQSYSSDLLIEDGIISALNPAIKADAQTKVIHASGKFVLAGFIDIHNHGSAGFDTSFGKYDQNSEKFDSSESAYKAGLNEALSFYLNMGVTKVLLTTMAAPLKQLNNSFRLIKHFLDENPKYQPLVHGINLEGTFLKDPAYAGAQNPAFFCEIDAKIIDELQASSDDLLKIVNIPPEHGKKGYDLTHKLTQEGIVVAGGHSAAFGDEYSQAVKAGLNLAVHFLNGPSRSNSKSFRMGGAVEVMLRSDEMFLEIICDGYHVDPSYVRDVIARKGHERVIMITDTMFANGMSDLKRFDLFGIQGAVSENQAYLQVLGSENTLFGSVLKSNVGFANVISWLTQELPGTWHRLHKALTLNDALVQASIMFSSNPAKLLGIYDMAKGQTGTGSIEVGKTADLIVAEFEENKLSITHNLLQGIIYETASSLFH